MSATLLLFLLLLFVGLIAVARKGVFTKGKGRKGIDHWPVFPKKVLTPVEQRLYHRLLRALIVPEFPPIRAVRN